MGGGGKLCLGMVVASYAMCGGVLLKVLRFFFFFPLLLRFLDLEFVGGPVVVAVVVVAVVHGWW